MNPSRSARAHGPGELTVAAVVLFALGAYGVAAGSVSGEQRAVAVGVFAFTLFAVGLIWPIATLSRVTLTVTAPPEATVGDEVELRIAVHGRAARVELRVLDPAGPWWSTAVPANGTVPHVATRRGVFDHVRVQIRTSAPLGVFIRTRQARVALPEPITIAPWPRAAHALPGPIPERAERPAEQSINGAGVEVVRAVRPYVPGDAARLVHWPSSARRGELVVREHDPPANLGLALVVDLSGPRDSAEVAASLAAGLGRSVLARGGMLVLSTREPDGAVCEPVADARTLGQRLARAIGGPPAPAPHGWPAHVVRAVEVSAAGS